MSKLKTLISATGILLLILSAASLYAAMQSMPEVRPAEDYEDQGVLTLRLEGELGRDRRNHSNL